jgi:hypothetical protein
MILLTAIKRKIVLYIFKISKDGDAADKAPAPPEEDDEY